MAYSGNESNWTKAYAEVNGLNMYYEIYGEGEPLVLIHGGGSTIETSFGRIIPLLMKKRKLIAVELQAHGHTNDREVPFSFSQDADDVVSLLNTLKVERADFLGFSNGGNTVIEIALRHPQVINKIILASTIYKRSGTIPGFWEGFESATLDVMPQSLQDSYLKANDSRDGLLNMFKRDVQRMIDFPGWTDDQMKSITAPVLVINGNNDVGTAEHAVEMYRVIPSCELVILPGAHGEYLGAAESYAGEWKKPYGAEIIEEFLDKV